MHVDCLEGATSAANNGHVDHSSVIRGRQLPEPGCGWMAEERMRAARENRSRFVGAWGDGSVADEVDPGVHRDQPARLDPTLDHARGEPGSKQLLTRDDPLLPAGESGQDAFELLRWTTYTVVKCAAP